MDVFSDLHFVASMLTVPSLCALQFLCSERCLISLSTLLWQHRHLLQSQNPAEPRLYVYLFSVFFSCPLGCFVLHTTVKLYQIMLLPCLGPPLPALRYVVYSTSGFANDVTFAHNRLRKVDASRPYTQSLTLSIRPRAAQKRGLSLTSTIALFYDDKDFFQKSYR